MRKLKNEIKIDRANGAADNASTEEGTMRNSSKKTPWFLRFAPGAILRKSGIIAVLAISTLLTTSIEQAEAASANQDSTTQGKKRRGDDDQPSKPPTPPAQRIVLNAMTGQQSAETRSGTITAVPSINEINSFKRTETVSDYTLHWRRLTTGTTVDTKTQSEHGYSAGNKWTEYFDVNFDMVVDNPDYDPDAEPGEPNSEKYKIEEGGGGGSRNEYGDSYMTRGDMIKKYSTSEYGRVTDSWGDKHVQLTKKGTWVYYGKSEKIKCEHELVDTIVNTDGRLAVGQKYKWGVRFQRQWLTYNGERFVEKETEKLKVLIWENESMWLNATSENRKNLYFLREKNQQLIDGPTALGQSRLYWKSRVEDGWFSAPRTIWERAQHDELVEKEKQEND